MYNINDVKLNKDVSKIFLLVYDGEGNLYGGTYLKKNRWKVEYRKFYEGLAKTGNSFKIFLVDYTTKDKIIFQDTIGSHEKVNTGD